MAYATEIASERRGAARRLPLVFGRGLSVLWPVADALVVVGLSILAGLSYHLLAYGDPGDLADHAKVGAAIALFRLILQHPVSSIAARPKGSLGYQFYLWNAAFLCLLAFGFLGKISGTYSRGAVLLFYVTGLPLLILWQGAWKYWICNGLNSGGSPCAMVSCSAPSPSSTSSGKVPSLAGRADRHQYHRPARSGARAVRYRLSRP